MDERLAQGPLFAVRRAGLRRAAGGPPRPAALRRAIAAPLRRAGYNTNPQLGSFQLRGDAILIKPGPQSYLATDGATITTTGGAACSPSPRKTARRSPPTSWSRSSSPRSREDKNRTKRRLVTYDQIPPQHGAGRHRH